MSARRSILTAPVPTVLSGDESATLWRVVAGDMNPSTIEAAAAIARRLGTDRPVRRRRSRRKVAAHV
jgi:hypothetical protein